MASRSGTANGANRDVERAYESGRCAILCGAGLVCDTMRARTACVLTDRDGVRATDRDDERHGAGPDGERRSGRRSKGGAATIGACERCGSEPRASVTERALLDEFTAGFMLDYR